MYWGYGGTIKIECFLPPFVGIGKQTRLVMFGKLRHFCSEARKKRKYLTRLSFRRSALAPFVFQNQSRPGDATSLKRTTANKEKERSLRS